MELIWLTTLEPNQIALNKTQYKELHQPDHLHIHIGLFKTTLKVKIINQLSDRTIGLPMNIADQYTIPTDIPYEIYHKGGEIHIGPVIGHVVVGSFENLNNNSLAAYLPRLAEYESIKGLFYVCTKDSIYPDQNLIKGYYYHPKGQKTGDVWRKGKFPLPNAMFNRSFISQKKIKALQEKMGDKIFNSYWQNLSKWDIYERLSKDQEILKHLPYTEKYSNIKQLKSFLKKYDSVYFKPFSKSRGVGILNIKQNKVKHDEIIVIDERKERYYFKDFKEVDDFLKKRLLNPSIIQQGVPFRVNNRMLDFRIILQRDQYKQWSYQGIFAKYSQPDSVITNGQSRDKVLDGKKALKDFFRITEEKAKKIELEMINIITKAIHIYEKSGIHIGDIAADIIVDSSLHLWLLELQLNHGISESLPPEIFKEIKVTPIRYAKALAGFNHK